MIRVRHVKPAAWVDTDEQGVIQPSEVAGLEHEFDMPTPAELGAAPALHAHTLANVTDWPATVSAVEVGYLDGVTSAIQTQLAGKAASSHSHVLAAGAVGSYALMNSTAAVAAGASVTATGANLFYVTQAGVQRGAVTAAQVWRSTVPFALVAADSAVFQRVS